MSSDDILEHGNNIKRLNSNNDYYIGKNLIDTILTYSRSVKNSDFKKCLSELSEYTSRPKLFGQNFKQIIKILLLNIENASIENSHTLVELLVAFIRDLKQRIIPILPDLIEFFRVLIIESNDVKPDYKTQLLYIFISIDDWPIKNFESFHKLFELWLITCSSSLLHLHSSYVIGITLKRFNYDLYRYSVKYFVDYSISLTSSKSYYNYIYSVGLILAHSLYSSDGSLSYNSSQLALLGLSIFDDLSFKIKNKDELLHRELLLNSLFTIYLNAFYHLKCMGSSVDSLVKIIKAGIEKYNNIVSNDLSTESERFAYKKLNFESSELSIVFGGFLSTNLNHSSVILSFFTTALIGLVYWAKPLTDINSLSEIEQLLSVLTDTKSLHQAHLVVLTNNLYLPTFEFLSDVLINFDGNSSKYSNAIQIFSKLLKKLITTLSQAYKVINDFGTENILIHFSRRTLFILNKLAKYSNKYPEALGLAIDVFKLVDNLKFSFNQEYLEIAASCLNLINDFSESTINLSSIPRVHNFLLIDGVRFLDECACSNHYINTLHITKISSILNLITLSNKNSNLFLENPFKQSFLNIFKKLISLLTNGKNNQFDCVDLVFYIISIYNFDFSEVEMLLNNFSEIQIEPRLNSVVFGIDFTLSSSQYFYSGVYHYLSLNKQLIKPLFTTEYGNKLLSDFFKQSISKLIIPIKQHQLLILDCIDEDILSRLENISKCSGELLEKLRNLVGMDCDVINSRAKVNSISNIAKDATDVDALTHIIVNNVLSSQLLYKFQPLWKPSVESIIALIKQDNELSTSLFGSDTLNYLFSLYYSYIKTYVNHILSGDNIYFYCGLFVNDKYTGAVPLHVIKSEEVQANTERSLDMFDLIKSQSSNGYVKTEYKFNTKRPFFYPVQSKVHSLDSFHMNVESHEEFADPHSIFENFNLIIPSIISKLGQNKHINYYCYTLDLLELISLLTDKCCNEQLGSFLTMINSILAKRTLLFDKELHNRLTSSVITIATKLLETFSKSRPNVKEAVVNFLAINYPKALKNTGDLINLIHGKDVKSVINGISNAGISESNALFNKVLYKIIISLLYTFDKSYKSDRLILIDFLNSSPPSCLPCICYEIFSDIISSTSTDKRCFNSLDDVIKYFSSQYNDFYEILSFNCIDESRVQWKPSRVNVDGEYVNILEYGRWTSKNRKFSLNSDFVCSHQFIHFIDWFNKNIIRLNILLKPNFLFIFQLIYDGFLIHLGGSSLPSVAKHKASVKAMELLVTIVDSLDLTLDQLLKDGLIQDSMIQILSLAFKFNKLFSEFLSLISSICKRLSKLDNFVYPILSIINKSFEQLHFDCADDFRDKFSSKVVAVLELYVALYNIKNDFEISPMEIFLKNTLNYWNKHRVLNNVELEFISVGIERASSYSCHLLLCLLTSKNIVNISFKDKDVKSVGSNLKLIIQCLSNLSQIHMNDEIVIEINKMISIYLSKCRDLKCRKLACEILSLALRPILTDINLEPFDSLKKTGYSVDALEYIFAYPNNITLWRYFTASILESLYCIRTHTLVIKLNIDDSINFLNDFTRLCVLETNRSFTKVNPRLLTPFLLPLLSNFFFFIRAKCDWIQEDMVFLKSIGIFFTNLFEKAIAMIVMGNEAESREGSDLLTMLYPLANSVESLINRNQVYSISIAIEIVQRICSIISKYKNNVDNGKYQTLLEQTEFLFGDLANTLSRTEGLTSILEFNSLKLSYYDAIDINFLFELNSVKRSKRALAIKNMTEMIDQLNFNTLIKFGVPLAKYYLKQPKASAKMFSTSLADACADFLSTLISKSPTRKGLVSSILDIKLAIGESRIYRIIVNGLKLYRFAFDDGYDSFLFDMLRILKFRVTTSTASPTGKAKKKGEGDVCVPWACSLYGLACNILESVYSHNILDEVMYITRRLIVILKSRDVNIRRTARDGLARLSTFVSSTGLVSMIEELNYSMDTGYKVPVLALTVSRLLRCQVAMESELVGPILATINKELRYILESDVIEKGIGDSKSSLKIDEGRRHHHSELCQMMGSKLDPLSAFDLYNHFIKMLETFGSNPKFLPKLFQMVEYTSKGISARVNHHVLELSNEHLVDIVKSFKSDLVKDFNLKEFYIRYACSLLDIIRSCIQNLNGQPKIDSDSIVYLFGSGNTSLRDRAGRCLLVLVKLCPELIDTFGKAIMHVCFDYFSNIQSHRDLSRTHLVLLKLFTLLQGTNLNEMQAKLVTALLGVSQSNLSIVNLRIPSLQMIRYIMSRKSLSSTLEGKLVLSCAGSVAKLALENRGESRYILEYSKRILMYSMEITPVDIFIEQLVPMLIKNVPSSTQAAFTLLNSIVSSPYYPNKSVYTDVIFFTSFSAMSSDLDKPSSTAGSDVVTNILKKWPKSQVYLIKTCYKLVEESWSDSLISAFAKISFLISRGLDSVRETSATLVQTNYQVLSKIAGKEGSFYSKVVFVTLKSFKNIIKLLDKNDQQFISKRRGVAEYIWKYIDFITTDGYKYGYTAVEASSLSCFIMFFNLYPNIIEYSRVVSIYGYCLDKLGFSKHTERQDRLREAIVEYLSSVIEYLPTCTDEINASEANNIQELDGKNYFERLQKKTPIEIFQSGISWLCFLARRHLGNIKRTFNRIESIISVLRHASKLPYLYTDDGKATLAKIVMTSRIMLNCGSMVTSNRRNKRKRSDLQDRDERLLSISAKANEILINIEKRMDSMDKSQDFIKIVQNANTVSRASYSLSLGVNLGLELLELLPSLITLNWRQYVKCLNTHPNVKHTLNLAK